MKEKYVKIIIIIIINLHGLSNNHNFKHFKLKKICVKFENMC